MRLPISTDEISPAWLGDMFALRWPGVAVLDMQSLNILSGTGTKQFLHLRYNDAGIAAGLPEQICVKAGFAAHREAMLFLYQLEARFFAELAPRIDVRVPHCLYAGSDEGQGLVILEDLTQAGAEICVVQRTLSPGQAAAFLESLAALHARWWNSPELADPAALGWLVAHDPLPEEAWGDFGRGQFQPETWAHYIAQPRGVALPNACRDRATMHAAIQALRVFGRSGPACVIHGDAHLGNMFIDAAGRPGFLDWQTVRKGHWAHDVCYFMVSALDPLDRRAHERDLVRGYLAALARHGVPTPPSEDEAWTAIRAHICYGLFYWLVNPVEWQAEVNNAAVAPRFAWAAVDHNAPPVAPFTAGG